MMKHRSGISTIIVLLLLLTGIFIFVIRADARAGGGHGFSGGSRSYSSRYGSTGRKREWTKAEVAYYREMNRRYLYLPMVLLAIAIVSGIFYGALNNAESKNRCCSGVGCCLGFFVAAIFLIISEIFPCSQFPTGITTLMFFFGLPIVKVVGFSNKKETKDTKFSQVTDFRIITKKDPSFDPYIFISRVKKAFRQIHDGWSKSDLSKSEAFLSDGTYEQFQIQINGMKANYIIDKIEDLVIYDAFITKIDSDSTYDSIYVYINATATNYRINSITKKYIEGDYKLPTPFSEIWCFMRRTGSKSIFDKGLIEGICPNCGKPIEGSRLSTCSSCGSQLRSGEHDWVLTGITQASEWRDTHNIIIPGVDLLKSSDPEFNIQNIEDKLSVMFWRMAEANRTNSPDPIRKISTYEFIEKYKHHNVYFAKYKYHELGSIEIVGIINDESKFNYLLGQITWSGKNSSCYVSYNKSLFVLKRSRECKTDSKKYFTSIHCQNCGAPMKISADNFCEYCNTTVNDLRKDWLLDNIYAFDTDEAMILITRARQFKKELQPKPIMPVSLSSLDTWHWNRNRLYNDFDYSDIRAISEKDIIRITVAMMLADGNIDVRERQLIQEICSKRTRISTRELECIIASTLRMSNPVDYTLNTIAIPNNLALLKVLINIAASDGNISDPEIQMLRKVASKMQVSPKALRDMINAVYEDNWNNK